MIVEVAFLPGAVLDVERKVAIVVDALRASSTIVAMFESGAEAVLVAASPEEAFEIAGADRGRFLICGERGGVPPPGFDYGNSPHQISRLGLAGRSVVLSTSNGTRALRAVAEARLALVGTGRNARAVAERALAIAERTTSDLIVVCAGDEQGTLFSLEDCYFAGCIVEQVAALRPFAWPVDESDPGPGVPDRWVLDESAVAARRLYRSYESTVATAPAAPAALAMFAEARNGHTLPRIGYATDLDFCAQVDVSNVVPCLVRRDGHFVLVANSAAGAA